MPEVDAARLKARLAVVEEHVECENRHDLPGLMATFGADARYAHMGTRCAVRLQAANPPIILRGKHWRQTNQ